MTAMGTIGRWAGALAGTLAVVVGLPLVAASPAVAKPGDPCDTVRQPYATTPGATLEPEVHTSKDTKPVRYVMWRGFVPSFDGLPLSVDVTVPCGGGRTPRPAVEMLH